MTGTFAFWRGPRIARSAAVTSVLIGLLVGACGEKGPEASTAQDSKSLALAAAQAIATAPGVGYSLSISTDFGAGGGRQGIDAKGTIDLATRRFSGMANGGAAGGTMLMFGGPTNGAVVVANGLFVKTEAGAWERQPDDQATRLDPFLDGAGLSAALATAFAASVIDPDLRTAPCGAETCHVIGLQVPPAALASLASYALGRQDMELPPDFHPVPVDLYVDGSGFLVRVETRLTAGTTVTVVTLQLSRLAPPPAIVPPIP